MAASLLAELGCSWLKVDPVTVVPDGIDSVGGAFVGAFAALVVGGAAIAILARLAFLVPDTPLDSLGPIPVREKIRDTLVASSVAEMYVDIVSGLPGSALGMVPGDFTAVFDVLDQEIFLREAGE